MSRSALYEAARSDREARCGGESAGAFFLTLCSVAAPVPVPELKTPALKRYRFFFTRQRAAGGERYWLHFGHFRTVEEAGKWRDVLKRVYPDAIIGSFPEPVRSTPARAF